jgi:hypothetical protein
VFLVLAVAGLVRSLQFTSSNSLTYVDLPPGKLSAGTSIAATAQQLSMALGVTWGAAWLAASAAVFGRAEPAVADFAVAFLGAALPALLAAPMAARLAPDAGVKASGHRAGG